MSDLTRDARMNGSEPVDGNSRDLTAARLPYQAPQIRRFGTVEDLTSALSGGGADGGTASMAGG
jgi:hypothetical protein